MRGTVTINGMDTEMVANAASPYIYKHVFREDFLIKLRDEGDEVDPDIFQKMGFVMAKQGESSNMQELMNLTINDYYEWLTQFEPMDLIEASDQIASLYLDQTAGSSVPKNEAD